MKTIKNKADYEKANLRLEELLLIVNNDTAKTDNNFIELDKISNLISDYEEQNYSIKPNNLVEIVRLRMYQRKLKQKDLAKILNTTPSRISEFLSGKLKLTYDFAKELYNKLNIEAELIFKY